jgi:hypothetical protein
MVRCARAVERARKKRGQRARSNRLVYHSREPESRRARVARSGPHRQASEETEGKAGVSWRYERRFSRRNTRFMLYTGTVPRVHPRKIAAPSAVATASLIKTGDICTTPRFQHGPDYSARKWARHAPTQLEDRVGYWR